MEDNLSRRGAENTGAPPPGNLLFCLLLSQITPLDSVLTISSPQCLLMEKNVNSTREKGNKAVILQADYYPFL